jgi:hypothetical protein
MYLVFLTNSQTFSCLFGLTKHASVVFFLTQVAQLTQQIGDHARVWYQIPPYLSLESTSFDYFDMQVPKLA